MPSAFIRSMNVSRSMSVLPAENQRRENVPGMAMTKIRPLRELQSCPSRKRSHITFRQLPAAFDKSIQHRKLVNAQRRLNIHHVELMPRQRDVVMWQTSLLQVRVCAAVDPVEPQQLDPS